MSNPLSRTLLSTFVDTLGTIQTQDWLVYEASCNSWNSLDGICHVLNGVDDRWQLGI